MCRAKARGLLAQPIQLRVHECRVNSQRFLETPRRAQSLNKFLESRNVQQAFFLPPVTTLSSA
jgi:hypothetical protein